MKDIEKRYTERFKRIISQLETESENENRLRGDLKVEEINYLLEQADNDIKDIKENYIAECISIINETIPILEATKYTELDLILMKLNVLFKTDKENKDSLNEILNEQDFNINKGLA